LLEPDAKGNWDVGGAGAGLREGIEVACRAADIERFALICGPDVARFSIETFVGEARELIPSCRGTIHAEGIAGVPIDRLVARAGVVANNTDRSHVSGCRRRELGVFVIEANTTDGIGPRCCPMCRS